MTKGELISACLGKQVVILVLPDRPVYGEKVRLCGRSGPAGELLCSSGDGLVVRFDAKKVLKFAMRLPE